MKNPINAFKRRMRSFGFGVHSPFAYHFIREVLFQPYGYYLYEKIDEIKGIDRRRKEDLKRLFRVILYFSPREIESVLGNQDVKQVVKLAKDSVVEYKTDRMIITNDMNAENLMEQDVTVILSDGKGMKADIKQVEDVSAKGRGMVFEGKRMTVVVDDENLPFQKYQVGI